IIRIPPRSILFPYTTLFRSKLSFKLIDEYRAEKNAVTSLTFKDISSVVNKLEIITPEDSIAAKDGTAKILVFAKNSAGNVLKNTDRKSTRLNSSHVKISYAV